METKINSDNTDTEVHTLPSEYSNQNEEVSMITSKCSQNLLESGINSFNVKTNTVHDTRCVGVPNMSQEVLKSISSISTENITTVQPNKTSDSESDPVKISPNVKTESNLVIKSYEDSRQDELQGEYINRTIIITKNTDDSENLEGGSLESISNPVSPSNENVLDANEQISESMKSALQQKDESDNFIDELKKAEKDETVTESQVTNEPMEVLDDEQSNQMPGSDIMEENSMNEKISGECESLISEDSSSAIISDCNKLNGLDNDVAQELISESSCSEYPASLDTPGPPTPMSATVETGSTGPTPVKRNRLGSIERSSHYKQLVSVEYKCRHNITFCQLYMQ